jgi:hypothetical protein
MILLILIPFIILLVTAWVAYYITMQVYKMLQQKEVKNARLISGVVFFLCFAVLVGLAFYFVIANIQLRR